MTHWAGRAEGFVESSSLESRVPHSPPPQKRGSRPAHALPDANAVCARCRVQQVARGSQFGRRSSARPCCAGAEAPVVLVVMLAGQLLQGRPRNPSPSPMYKVRLARSSRRAMVCCLVDCSCEHPFNQEAEDRCVHSTESSD
jgi:hypothetical protein